MPSGSSSYQTFPEIDKHCLVFPAQVVNVFSFIYQLMAYSEIMSKPYGFSFINGCVITRMTIKTVEYCCNRHGQGVKQKFDFKNGRNS